MTERTKADKDALGRIHGILADVFEDVLLNGEVAMVTDKETGERVPIRTTVSPAMAGQIRQFLRDNGIEADLTKRKLGQSLAAVLPFAGSEQERTG
jgi:hypothetical protein